jgi:hypothetical protein
MNVRIEIKGRFEFTVRCKKQKPKTKKEEVRDRKEKHKSNNKTYLAARTAECLSGKGKAT